jgi:hypothetical protein
MARHGTLTNYTKNRCRCAPCAAVAARYSKAWRTHRILGRPPLMVDAAPIRAHVTDLQERGMSFRAISLAAGYKSRNSLKEALSRETVRRGTRDRILTVRPESDLRENTYVAAHGTRRRLQALAIMGHPSRELATLLGVRDHSGLLDIMRGDTTKVRRATHNKVARLYDTLWNIPGRSLRTRKISEAKGWSSPLAWDDNSIDSPDAVPQGATTWGASKSRRHADLIEDFHDTFHEHRGDARAAAVRLGVSHVGLTKALYRERAAGGVIDFFNGAKHQRKAA